MKKTETPCPLRGSAPAWVEFAGLTDELLIAYFKMRGSIQSASQSWESLQPLRQPCNSQLAQRNYPEFRHTPDRTGKPVQRDYEVLTSTIQKNPHSGRSSFRDTPTSVLVATCNLYGHIRLQRRMRHTCCQ